MKSSKIIPGEELGRGSYGRVYAVTWQGRRVAVKYSLPGDMDSFNKLQNEEYILNQLAGCEHIVSVLGSDNTFINDSHGAVHQVVMELVEGGSLSSHIRRKGGRLSEDEARCIARMVTEGLIYIHSKNYVHCDIKPGNLLVTKEDALSRVRVKIADFGLAKKAGTRVGNRGTSGYMSPEALIRGECEPPMDVWGLGCVVLDMLVGKVWHWSRLPSKLSYHAKDFLGHCFAIDPRRRWTAKELLQHPFLDITNLGFGTIPAAGGNHHVEEKERADETAAHAIIVINSDDEKSEKIEQPNKWKTIIITDDDDEVGQTNKKRKN